MVVLVLVPERDSGHRHRAGVAEDSTVAEAFRIVLVVGIGGRVGTLPVEERVGTPAVEERVGNPPVEERLDTPAVEERVDTPAAEEQGHNLLWEPTAPGTAMVVLALDTMVDTAVLGVAGLEW